MAEEISRDIYLERNTCPSVPSGKVAHFSNLSLEEERDIMESLLNDSEILIANTFFPTVAFDKEELIQAAQNAKSKLTRLGI